MHEAIRDHLEEYLRGPADRKIPIQFREHLATCADCSQELQDMEAQSEAFRVLRAGPQVEPAPGFYARVMNRIEAQKTAESFWSPLIDSAFGKRLAYGVAALVLVVGTYLFTSDSVDRTPAPTGLVVADTVSAPSSSAAAEETVQPQQRDAVLVNLASYQE
jgi:anti-sigma factor RsiW